MHGIQKAESKLFILLSILAVSSLKSTDLFLLPKNTVAAVVVGIELFIFRNKSCKNIEYKNIESKL